MVTLANLKNFIQALFGSRKMLRKGKKMQRKIVFFSLDDMENKMEKKYKGKYERKYCNIFPIIFLKK